MKGLKVLLIFFIILIETIYCNSVKDVLYPGNKRAELSNTSCKSNGGVSYWSSLDSWACNWFKCNDNTKIPIKNGTPCKQKSLSATWGHCLNNICLSSEEILEKNNGIINY